MEFTPEYAYLLGLIAGRGTFVASKKRIIISPHGPLHYLPFQLLHDGEKYLLEDYTLNYIPSATVLRYLADKPPIGPLEPEGEPEFIGSVADNSSYLPGWGTEGSYEHSDSKPPKSILLLGKKMELWFRTLNWLWPRL